MATFTTISNVTFPESTSTTSSSDVTDQTVNDVTTNPSSSLMTGDNVDVMPLQPAMVFLNRVVLVTSVVIFFSDLIGLHVLKNCKKIPFQTRYFSMSCLMSDALGALVMVVNQLIVVELNIVNAFTLSTRVVTVGSLTSVSWYAVTALAMDRAFALKKHLHYPGIVTRRRVLTVIFCGWLLHAVTIPIVYVYGFQKHCEILYNNCDFWKSSKDTRLFLLSLMVASMFLLSASYIIVFKISKRHSRQIADLKNAVFRGNTPYPKCSISERQFSATKAVVAIVLAFILLNSPMAIHLFVFESNIEHRDTLPRRVFNFLSVACLQVNSFVSLGLYVGKFRECKMHFYSLVSKVSKKYAIKAERLRMDVYNIVISTADSDAQTRNHGQYNDAYDCQA